MPDISIRNQLERVQGVRLCPVQPVMRGLRAMSYPWRHMEPGHVFIVDNPSREARARLSAAASAVARREGWRFATGSAWAEGEGGQPVQTGWWCVRIDGVEVLPPEPTIKQQREAERRAEWEHQRRMRDINARKGRLAKQRIEPITQIGQYAPEAAAVEHEPVDYEAWVKPAGSGEYV